MSEIYKVSAGVTLNVEIAIRAGSKEEALQIFEDRLSVTILDQADPEDDAYVVVDGSIDSVDDITVESAEDV